MQSFNEMSSQRAQPNDRWVVVSIRRHRLIGRRPPQTSRAAGWPARGASAARTPRYSAVCRRAGRGSRGAGRLREAAPAPAARAPRPRRTRSRSCCISGASTPADGYNQYTALYPSTPLRRTTWEDMPLSPSHTHRNFEPRVKIRRIIQKIIFKSSMKKHSKSVAIYTIFHKRHSLSFQCEQMIGINPLISYKTLIEVNISSLNV